MSQLSIPIYSGASSMFDWGHQAVTINLGTPPQIFHALLEISRPDTVIPSIRVAKYSHDYDDLDDVRLDSNRYDDSKSSTSEKLGDEVIEYAMEDDSLYLEGYKTLETMSIGNVAVEKQTFCNLFDVADRAGLFGAGDNLYYTRLGFAPNVVSSAETTASSGELQKPSIFQTMIDQGLLERNVIGLKPARFMEYEGVLHLGWCDSSYADNLIEIPISHLQDDVDKRIQSPWHVSVHSITIGENIISLKDHHVFFSTSTSFMRFPKRLLNSIEKDLGLLGSEESEEGGDGEGRKLEDYPFITFSFGPQQTLVTIPPSAYTEKALSDFSDEIEEPSGYRWAPIDSYEEDDDDGLESNIIILGTAFLRAFYTVFDADAHTISFAPLETDASVTSHYQGPVVSNHNGELRF